MKTKRESAQEDVIDFKGILYKFFSRWYYFVIASILSYGFAKVYIKYQESIYRVSSTIIIKQEDGAQRLVGINVFAENVNLHNEIGLIRSFDMVKNVISELDFDVSYYWDGNIRKTEFYKDSPFIVALDTNAYQLINTPFYITILPDNKFRIEAEINGAQIYDLKTTSVVGQSGRIVIKEELKSGQHYQNGGIGFTVYITNPHFVQKDTKLYFVVNDRNILTQFYKSKLSVVSVNKESSIVELSVAGPSVRKDIDFINKLAEVYIKSGLEEKNIITTNTIKFIDDQLLEISSSLKETEGDMETFRADSKVLNVSEEISSQYSQLNGLEKEKGELVLNQKYYDYIIDYIHSNKNIKDMVVPSALGISDPVLGTLISELIKLKSERAVIGPSTSEKNPYLRNLDDKITYATASLLENLANIKNGSQILMNDYNNRIAIIEHTLNKLPQKERKMMDLERKFNLNDHLYNFLLERRAEAGIAKAANKADDKILDKASMLNSYQIAPKRDLIFTSSFLIGLIVPFLLIVISDFLNDKILSREELEKVTSIPILGMIGHNKSETNIAITDNPKSMISEMFRSTRANLQYLIPDKTKNVIGITSSISGEGKTFCSINLAAIIAVSGKKTLLIGADLRRPKIFGDFGLTNDKGLSTYLSNQHSLEQIINRTRVANLDLITAGPVPPNPSELLGSDKAMELIRQLKERYDFVIIDTAPVGMISDYIVMKDIIDTHIYIVRHNYTNKKQLVKINDLYDSGKIKNVSILINDIKGVVGEYYYGYGYGYGYYENNEKGVLARVKKYLSFGSSRNILRGKSKQA